MGQRCSCICDLFGQICDLFGQICEQSSSDDVDPASESLTGDFGHAEPTGARLDPSDSFRSLSVAGRTDRIGNFDRRKEHFVDKYKDQLILGVRNVEPILDELLTKGVIQQESYDKIRARPTSQEKMTELFDAVKSVGVRDKNILYNSIKRLEPRVIDYIKPRYVGQSLSVDTDSSQGLASLRPEEVILTLTEMDKMSPVDDWIKLEPEVNCIDAQDGLMYSLQSKAGKFECSVSGLRWVCKEKVNFKYQFASWEEHMDRLETMQYIAVGPLVDITVIAGKLDEVYLPHWICTEDDPTILGKFAVLHIDTCGDVVEKASEVTPSHVKLCQPVFSPRGVLMKAGFPVKIYCKVLIYKTNKAFLTLHVYLIPRDPALQQKIKNKELSSGCKLIEKPHPEEPLKMRDCFSLTADKDGAKINPKNLKLIYESSDPNFFEVFIKNPDDLELKLEDKKIKDESVTVWNSTIRKGDYPVPPGMYGGEGSSITGTTGAPAELESVDTQSETGQDLPDGELARVRPELVGKLNTEVINQLLDDLLKDGVLNDGEKDLVQGKNTTADRARCLIDMVRKKGRKASQKIFIHLHSRDPTLCAELGLPTGLPV